MLQVPCEMADKNPSLVVHHVDSILLLPCLMGLFIGEAMDIHRSPKGFH